VDPNSANLIATFDLKTDANRPTGWTSADAAGLPIFPGLVHYDEVGALKKVAGSNFEVVQMGTVVTR
jgi:hypothetical protein